MFDVAGGAPFVGRGTVSNCTTGRLFVCFVNPQTYPKCATDFMKTFLASFGILFAFLLPLSTPSARAADHGDAPFVSLDQGSEITDFYSFLDPNDNSQLVLIGATHGFIVPGEALNFGVFDPRIRFRFNLENTGDAVPDRSITVTFSQRTSTSTPQTATIRFSRPRQTFTAPVTNPSVDTTAPPQIVTTFSNGVQFFAGVVDDPFFFDVPAELRWVASILAGERDDSLLTRGRDTFAGYNVVAIAMRIPVSLIGTSRDGVIGMNFATEKTVAPFQQIDRLGVPLVNMALIPFARKDEYNASKPPDDASGRFLDDITATLRALGTNDANIDVLTGIAVTNGDLLRLNVHIPNVGPQGGTNPNAAFPNGRRPADDVIDTIVTIINNGSFLGDNVNANDLAFQNKFPFLALSQQPRLPGTIDDNTRN